MGLQETLAIAAGLCQGSIFLFSLHLGFELAKQQTPHYDNYKLKITPIVVKALCLCTMFLFHALIIVVVAQLFQSALARQLFGLSWTFGIFIVPFSAKLEMAICARRGVRGVQKKYQNGTKQHKSKI